MQTTMAILSKYKPTRFNGFVEFEISNIYHRSFGYAKISGNFPRLKPLNGRGEIHPKILTTLINKFTEQVQKCGINSDSFDRIGNIESVVEVADQFSLFWNPGLDWDSTGIEFYVWFLIFSWIFDDAFQEGWYLGHRMTRRDMAGIIEHIQNTYLRIMRMQKIKKSITAMILPPNFDAICNVLKRMVQAGFNLYGNEYAERIEPFVLAFHDNFESADVINFNPVDDRWGDQLSLIILILV